MPEIIPPSPPTTDFDSENTISIEPAMPPLSFKSKTDKKKITKSKTETTSCKTRRTDDQTLAELLSEARRLTEKSKVKSYGYLKKFKPKTLENRLIGKPRKITSETEHTIGLEGKLYHKIQVVKWNINLQDSKTITRGKGGKFAGKGGGIEEVVPKVSPTKQRAKETSVTDLSDNSPSPAPKIRSPRKSKTPKSLVELTSSEDELEEMEQEPPQNQQTEQMPGTSQSAELNTQQANEGQEIGEAGGIENVDNENTGGEGEVTMSEFINSHLQVKTKSPLNLRKSTRLRTAKPIDKFGAVI